jgi:hypothetical protein
MSVQVEAAAPAPVEHMDLRGVADAEQRRLQRDGIVDAQGAYLGLADRRG